MEISLLIKTLLPVITKTLPYLKDVGKKSAEKIGEHIGDTTWNLGKKIWDKIFPKIKSQPVVLEGFKEAAESPDDPNAHQVISFLLKSLLKNDSALAEELSALAQEAGHLQLVSQNDGKVAGGNINEGVSIQNSSVGGSVFSNILGNIEHDIHYHSPSIRDRQQKEERDKVIELLNQLDRAAVNAHMHEENIYFMIRSLNEARREIQRLGASTIEDLELRLYFTMIKTDIDKINAIANVIVHHSKQYDWRNSILDLRSFGGVDNFFGHNSQESAYMRIFTFVKERFDHHYKYARTKDFRKLPNDYLEAKKEADMRGVTPAQVREIMIGELPTEMQLDIECMANDASALYLFGAIDQLKYGIQEKARLILQKIHYA